MNRTVFIILLFFAYVCPAFAADERKVIIFPQGTRLEQCIRSNIPNSYLNPLFDEDAAKVVHLRCNDPYVTSFEGIEQFPNIESIDMGGYGTMIDNITPLASLPRLTRLEMPRSEVDNITPLVSLPNLYYLDLSENHVTDLWPLDNLTQLETLILYRQAPDYITDLTPLDNLTRIYALNLESNRITDIGPLHRMHNLRYLHMADNRLTSVKVLDNLTGLHMVNFNINMLTDLTPLDNSTGLTTVYANNNRITGTAFVDNLTKLTHLELSQNNIDNVSSIGNIPRPILIALDKNRITDISPLKRIIHDGYLQELGLSYNCIPDIDNVSLYIVRTVRKNHQCEALPPVNDYDISTVVNGDLLGPAAPLDNISDNTSGSVNDNVSALVSTPSGPGGCSAGGGNISGWILLLSVPALWLVFRKRFCPLKL